MDLLLKLNLKGVFIMKKSTKIITSFALLGTLLVPTTAFAKNKTYFLGGRASGSLSVSGSYAYASTYSDGYAHEMTARLYDSVSTRSNVNNEANGSDHHNARASIKINSRAYNISGYHKVSGNDGTGSGSTYIKHMQ